MTEKETLAGKYGNYNNPKRVAVRKYGELKYRFRKSILSKSELTLRGGVKIWKWEVQW